MLARVRNRRGIVASVEPYDSPHGDDAGRLHLVQVEYKDHDSPHSALGLDGEGEFRDPVSYTHLTLPTIYSV